MGLLNNKIQTIAPSITLKIDAMAKKMKAEGQDIVSFGAGEPDFDTPDFIKEKAIASIRAGETKYTDASGTPALKAAVAAKLKKENGLEYAPSQIVVSCGAKHSLYNILQVLLDPGDEVIIFSPFWVSYLEHVKLADGKPVLVDTTAAHFRIDFKELKKKLTPKAKLIIINSPQNPTGVVYPREDLEQLANLILEQPGLMVLSDEIYEKLIFGQEKHFSIAQLGADIKERTILVNGLSKTYAMTGWRIGYMAGPEEVARAVSTLQSHSTSNPTTFCQTASITALEHGTEEIAPMIAEFAKRRDLIHSLLSGIPGFKTQKPEGAFYIFPDISGITKKRHKGLPVTDDLVFCEILLKEKKVAVVPGSAFGARNHIRLSFATSEKNIETGISRIKEFVQEME
jgi:aspartate aminotransferase